LMMTRCVLGTPCDRLLTPVTCFSFCPAVQRHHFHCHVCQRQGRDYVYFKDAWSLQVCDVGVCVCPVSGREVLCDDDVVLVQAQPPGSTCAAQESCFRSPGAAELHMQPDMALQS
jgi:hypothetical protein